MKKLSYLLLFFSAQISFAQSAIEGKDMIKKEAMNTDSLDYPQMWENISNQLKEMGGIGRASSIYEIKIDAEKKAAIQALYFEKLSLEFELIYQHLIGKGNYEIVKEGDFYKHRMWFYIRSYEFAKAIQEAEYLYQYWSGLPLTNNTQAAANEAISTLYYLYIIEGEYSLAEKIINEALKENSRNKRKLYFRNNQAAFSYKDKIKLLEYSKRAEEIIPFLKEKCLEDFDWYFANYTREENDYIVEDIKNNGFYKLKEIITYMEKDSHAELKKYESIYSALADENKSSQARINPNLKGETLKEIIEGLR